MTKQQVISAITRGQYDRISRRKDGVFSPLTSFPIPPYVGVKKLGAILDTSNSVVILCANDEEYEKVWAVLTEPCLNVSRTYFQDRGSVGIENVSIEAIRAEYANFIKVVDIQKGLCADPVSIVNEVYFGGLPPRREDTYELDGDTIFLDEYVNVATLAENILKCERQGVRHPMAEARGWSNTELALSLIEEYPEVKDVSIAIL